ncbi:uncharacterized protein SOCE26_001630 [Sorangium cellulosum]|uniref:Uncharacterized protein n=1 Tax=Sorangium cellulosum TaxID=56 RepID=A0A2L0EHL0_SORCE|nr:uncharacterized protein SOCE26_001630 [Sorangium cellulosum]
MLAAGQIVVGVPLLEQAAAREGTALRDVRLAIDQLCKGEARPRSSGDTTFAEFAERVLSGQLAEQYPLHVKPLRHPEQYRHKPNHVLGVLGPVPLPRFTVDHADRAVSMLPAHLEAEASQKLFTGYSRSRPIRRVSSPTIRCHVDVFPRRTTTRPKALYTPTRTSVSWLRWIFDCLIGSITGF